MSPHSALVLRHAAVRTLGPRAEDASLAIVNGRIAAVGRDEEVWAAVGSDRPSVNLGGRLVLPGFIDAHVHWANYALARRNVRLDPSHTLSECVKRSREWAGSQPGRGWVQGRGWDHTQWRRWPNAADLDAVIPDRPVALVRKDGHALWVNSAGLAAAGVSAATPDPPGGEIARHDGEPTGILKETAMRLVTDAIPAPDPDERQAAMVDAWPDAWCRGVVGCHDMGHRAAGALFRDLATLRDAGELGLRFAWYFTADSLDEAIALGLRSGLGDEWLRVGGLKLYLDGTLGSQTADMLEPYAGQPDNRGIPTHEPEAFNDLVLRAANAGIATAVHAIGDAANRKALDCFARLRRQRPSRAAALRHRIEHAQLLHPDDIGRFARLGVTASMQPIHATADMTVAERHWGDRSAHAYAWRSLLDSGARLAFGSDAPIETLDVFAGIHAAVTRQNANHEPRGGWHAGQSVSVADAIRAYTTGAAWAASQEHQLGSLTVGRRADLIVLGHDPFAVPASELPGCRVLATMIEGVWVWQAAGVDYGGPRHEF